MLYLLAESMAARMRDLAARCMVVELYVRETGLVSFTRWRKLAVPTCSSAEIAQAAFELFLANYRWSQPIRSIDVRGAELVEADTGVQTSLLDVCRAASADLAARLRTSSATTENPFPAFPARAASTAAFRARMLVWNAMSLMVLMMVPIWAEDWSIFLVAAVNCSIFASASTA